MQAFLLIVIFILIAINLKQADELRDLERKTLDDPQWRAAGGRKSGTDEKVYETENECIYFTDGKTCWVKTGIESAGLEHIEYLPIMDYKKRVTSQDMSCTKWPLQFWIICPRLNTIGYYALHRTHN